MRAQDRFSPPQEADTSTEHAEAMSSLGALTPGHWSTPTMKTQGCLARGRRKDSLALSIQLLEGSNILLQPLPHPKSPGIPPPVLSVEANDNIKVCFFTFQTSPVQIRSKGLWQGR